MSVFKELMGFKKWVKSVVPKGDFDESKIPTAPNYQELEFWAAHPNKENKSSFKPQGVGADDLPLDADVFYLHPTSYFGQNNWNYDFKHFQATELIEEVLMPLQASAFNGCCRIFAPKYRQATFYTFLWNTQSGRDAMELAYTDVLAAFQYYLEYENKGRPFFIASHSQGSCHAMRLLEEEIDASDYANRMIAAYVIGFRFPEEKFTKGFFKQLKISESATDTSCVIAYDTYLEKGKPAHLIDRAEIYFPNQKKWIKRAYKKPIGVNPLSWKRTHEKVSAEHNLGAISLIQANPETVNRKAFGSDTPMNLNTIGIKAPYKAEVSAQLRKDGFLYASSPKHHIFKRMMLPGGNLHNYDYDLFYMNIRKNIKERLSAFLNK